MPNIDFDEGYSAGVIDAVEYLSELYEGVYDTDIFSKLGIVTEGRRGHPV